MSSYSKQPSLKEESKKIAAILREKEKHKERERYEISLKKKQAEDLKKLRKEELKRQEEEFKTKKYFEFNKYDRKVTVEGAPYFKGELELASSAWRPDGPGKFVYDDRVALDGLFIKGDFVSGKFVLPDGSVWEGQMHHDLIHGIGKISKPECDSEEALAYRGHLICTRKDLCIGAFLEFEANVFENYGQYKNNPKASIISYIREWDYKIRFHEEVWPQERIVNLSNIGKFTLRKDKPIVYNLSVYNESPDCRRVDDYRNYLVSKIERKLIPNFPEREGSRRTNMFESREVGIGATREVAEREEKEKLKKIQWKKFVEEKKAKFIADRQKRIEEEQAKFLESSLSEAKQKKKEEEELEEIAAKERILLEMEKFDEENKSIS